MTLNEEGHLNRAYRVVKDKIKDISKIDLIKMMTINTARANNLRYVGAIAPGYQADVVVVDNLDNLNVVTTIANGKIIYSKGKFFVLDFSKIKKPKSNFDHKKFTKDDFKINFTSTNEPAIVAKSFHSEKSWIKVIGDGAFAASGETKISLIDHYNKTNADNFTCFIHKIGISKGAYAQTINHDSHATIVVGKSNSDMALAVNQIKKQGGGFCAF